MIQKSYNKSKYGDLYLIPTPIGNMEDITFRAINTLKMVDKIYAEDTRVTNILLNKYSIRKKIDSCHKFSEEKNKDKIIEELKNGMNIAYASDRGTPLISDPGSVIVSYAIENNINVIALPGPSALLPALNMSGISSDRFFFYGFLNNKKSQRIEELKKLVSNRYTIIFYEAPHRINQVLNDILNVFGNRNVSICREISKIHEEVFRGTIKDSIEYYKEPKGEFVIVVEGNNSTEEINYLDKVKELINKGYKPSAAIKEIAILYGISKNKLYKDCEEML